MELSSVSPASLAASQQAGIREQIGASVLKKSLDIEAALAAQMMQMMARQTGLGQTIDTQG